MHQLAKRQQQVSQYPLQPPQSSHRSLEPSPQGFQPDIVHLALAMGGFAIGIAEFAIMSLLPFFARDLHISEPVAGHVISAYALGVVVGAPLIAVLSARIPRKTILISLMMFFALMNGLSGLAPDYRSMIVLRFLAGLPHGAYFGIAMLVATSLVPSDKRTGAVGRVLLGLTVATIVGVPMANGIGQTFGWRWAFAIVAALALLTAVFVAILPRVTWWKPTRARCVNFRLSVVSMSG